MKGKLEELGEESEGVESISKIQTQILNLTKGKVNIFDNVGNFRDTYDIINDIAKVWKEISQTDQAALLEVVAGRVYLYVQKCTYRMNLIAGNASIG